MVGQRPVDKSQTQSYCNEYQFGKYSVVRNCINYASHASAYKLMHLDVDDHQLLSETYQTMYPQKNIQANTVSKVSRWYVSVYLAEEKIVSKLECRSLRSARAMASWTRNDAKIDPSEAIRPGFVKFFFVNCLRLERSTRSMCSPVLSGEVKTHRGPFAAGLLRYGDRKLSI